MTWTFTPADTKVEFTFTALGPRLTKAAVEHRGWEALSDEQIAEDCALPGGYSSGAYPAGWSIILARMTESIGRAGVMIGDPAALVPRGSSVSLLGG